MKQNKPKLKKEGLARRMQLEAAVLKQANKSQGELRIADLLEAGAERIEDLEGRLCNRSAS